MVTKEVNRIGDYDEGPVSQVSSSVRKLLADCLELAELQFALFAQEFGSNVRWLALGVIAAAVGLLGAFVGFILLAFAAASGLSALTGWNIAICQFTIAAVFILIAGISAKYASVYLVQKAFKFNRSASELKTNLAWLRRLLNAD